MGRTPTRKKKTRVEVVNNSSDPSLVGGGGDSIKKNGRSLDVKSLKKSPRGQTTGLGHPKKPKKTKVGSLPRGQNTTKKESPEGSKWGGVDQLGDSRTTCYLQTYRAYPIKKAGTKPKRSQPIEKKPTGGKKGHPGGKLLA